MSVDEAMIPFKGRSSLANSENRYITNFQVYNGKQGDSTGKGLGAKVV